MTRELESIDISQSPELARIAEEVQKSMKPRLLRRDKEDVAIVMPVTPTRQARVKAAPLTGDDSLFRLIGIGKSGIPGGASGKKHERLGKAYRHADR